MTVVQLEDFGPVALQPVQLDSVDTTEEERLVVFEQGYSAGWDDAVKAQAENSAIASEDLVNHLRDLSFTFHEAVQHMASELEPFLQALVEQLVPEVVEHSVVLRIADQLGKTAGLEQNNLVLLRCSPQRHAFLTSALNASVDMPLAVTVDRNLAPDAVILEFGSNAQDFDFSSISQHIRNAIDAYVFATKQETLNG